MALSKRHGIHALVVPRRARGGQQVSAAQSDNGTHHRAGTVDLQADKTARKPGSGACDGYPQRTRVRCIAPGLEYRESTHESNSRRENGNRREKQAERKPDLGGHQVVRSSNR
ncbi:hypothetical protein LF1_52710 [Rubripirellula obstinata]|uniref:Uncharacterized protein n=1 Tax=Rubripirellula obstinata TaxID=406547 RepID=A0A5B1CAW5_9BACT|nr:hypothetical protein LF1_52710 [Rubripirellula obstinata]